MRLLVLALCLVGLAACTSWRVQADADCRAYGYLPQTDAYAACLERAHVAYRERWQALVVKARHGFLYIFAESSRLYLRNCSSTSKYEGERQNTRSARVRRHVHIAGLLPFRHSRLASALV